MDKRATVLFVDDEERILRSLQMLFRGKFRVLATTDGNVAVDVVRREKVHVIVSDQRMPVMPGIELLRRVREASPNTMRMLLTGYADLEATIGSINEGEVFRYLTKPWNSQEIVATVSKAAEIALSLEDVAADAGEAHSAPGVLVIDDDPSVAEMVRSICGPAQSVKWSVDLDEAFEILSASDVAIVICDVRLRGRDISDAVKVLKQTNPAILTIVHTQLQDVELLRGLINHGQIYRFLPKPVRRGMLEMSLSSAARFHANMQATPTLARRVRAEPTAPTAANGLSGRIIGYLERMRQQRAS